MDDAELAAVLVLRLVRGVQAVEDRRDDRRGDARRDRNLPLLRRLHQLGERLAGDVLHDDEDLALGRDDVERGHDVRVTDAPAEARLVEEHRDELGILRELRMQALDGDGAREADGAAEPSEVDGGHPARGELSIEHVAPTVRGCACPSDRTIVSKITAIPDGVRDSSVRRSDRFVRAARASTPRGGACRSRRHGRARAKAVPGAGQASGHERRAFASLPDARCRGHGPPRGDRRAVVIEPRARLKVPTGLSVAIPHGYEGQVRPRSGLAAKHGVTVVNTPGTVDSDYRGEIAVVLVNLGTEPVTIAPLDRIAQIVFARHETATLVEVADLDDTERGSGGYGSTGG